jgi:hypothetical protein
MNGLSLEAEIMRIPRGAGPGYTEDMPIPLTLWTLDSGAGLDATTTAVRRLPVAGTSTATPLTTSPLHGLQWPAASTQTARISTGIMLPGQWRRGTRKNGDKPAVHLLVHAKQSGTGTDQNVSLNATASWVNPSYSDAGTARDNPDETAPLQLTVPATSVNLSPISVAALTSRFRVLRFDLTNAMTTLVNARTAAERLMYWCSMTVTLGITTPAAGNVTLNANTTVDIIGTSLSYVRNASYWEARFRKINN